MADENEARVYGMADQANRSPPAAQGLRGEQTTTRPSDANPALKRVVTLDSGRLVELREDSGVGWAEAEGRAGLADQGEARPDLPPAPPRRRSGVGLMLLALAGGLAAGAIASRAGRTQRARDPRDRRFSSWA